jgi:uncharacterized protein YjdB
MSDRLKINVGQTTSLQALHQSAYGVGPAVQADVVWTSSDDAVATVAGGSAAMSAGSSTSTATVTGVAAGDADITATTSDGKTNTFPVTVVASGNADQIAIVHLQ